MLVIKGARVTTASGPGSKTPWEIEGGTVIIENGKISKVGANLDVPEGAAVIDGTGMIVTPGLCRDSCRVRLQGEHRSAATRSR